MTCINVVAFTVERCEPRSCDMGRFGPCEYEAVYDWTTYLDNEQLARRTVAARTALYVAEALCQETGQIKRRGRKGHCLKHASVIAEAFLPGQGIPAQLLTLLPGYTLIGSIRFDPQEPLKKRGVVERKRSGVNVLFDRIHELNWHYDRASLELVKLDHCAEMEQAG